GHAGHTIQAGRQFPVLAYGRGVDVDQDRKVPARPMRRVGADQRFDARALEADRVEHPAGCLGDPVRRRARTWLQEDALRNHAAEAPPVAERNLGAVRECPGRGHHRRLEPDAAHLPRAAQAVTRSWRCAGNSAHRIEAARYTGPSVQALSYTPEVRGTAQPRHTPVPHPIYVSTATWASGQRAATAASILFGPHPRTWPSSERGTASRAEPWTPVDPSSVAQKQ